MVRVYTSWAILFLYNIVFLHSDDIKTQFSLVSSSSLPRLLCYVKLLYRPSAFPLYLSLVIGQSALAFTKGREKCYTLFSSFGAQAERQAGSSQDTISCAPRSFLPLELHCLTASCEEWRASYIFSDSLNHTFTDKNPVWFSSPFPASILFLLSSLKCWHFPWWRSKTSIFFVSCIPLLSHSQL